MSFITNYLDYQLKYEKLYGHKTVVVSQNGTFYDILEYDPVYCVNEEDKIDDNKRLWDTRIGHAVTISSNVLDCVLTKNSKKRPYSIRNTDKLGFPCTSYPNKLKTLLAHDYVVVRIDQQDEKDDSDKAVRFVADICSPIMTFNNITLKQLHVHVISIYIEFNKRKSNHYDTVLLTSGLSVVDMITGETKITEFYSKDNDEICCTQNIYKFLISHQPKEIIIYIDDVPEDIQYDYTKYLEKILELKRYDRCLIKINELDKEYKKLNYQIEFFNKLYTKTNCIQQKNYNIINDLYTKTNCIQQKNYNIINDLDLENLHYGRLAFILLIDYCKLNNGPIDNIKPPHTFFFDENQILLLTHNSALCLDIIPRHDYKNKSINSLFSVMNKTCTKVGERCLEYLLLNPMVDSYDIQKYYDMIDECLKQFKNNFIWQQIEDYLKGLPDIARLQRKVELNLLTPKDLAVLIRTYIKIKDLISYLQQNNILGNVFSYFNQDTFFNFIEEYTKIFNLEQLECCYIDDKKIEFNDNIVNNNVELNHYFKTLYDNDKKLNDVHDYLNTFLKKGQVKFTTKKLDKKGKVKKGANKGESEMTLLTASTANTNKLLSSSYDVNICGELKQSPYSSTDKIISSNTIEQLCHIKDDTKKLLGIKLYNVFIEYVNNIKSYNFFTPLCNLLGKIDLIHCYAKLAYQNKYFKPTIYHDGNCFLKCKEMRHPIVEQLIDGEYIVNDVCLGKMDENDESEYGLLLLSINCAGKSTLLKGICLNIVMAQAGSFVPSQLTYKPYTKIITRLNCQDNIFTGESSYEVELKELNTALKQGQQSSLVILDEIAKSTETQSAICITVSTIIHLIKNKVSFAIASHLHEIVNLPYILNLGDKLIKIQHSTVTYDEVNDLFIYNRKLKDGSGCAKYGIDVAKYLKLPKDFIEQCNEIALYLEKENKEFLNTKKSRYNSKVYMDQCSLCGTTQNLITHHIVEQQYADALGYINHMHKNVKDNLIVLCEQCHVKKIHNDKKDLVVHQTTNGNIVTFK
jgi:DNA mismatch repair protein MutS